MCRFIWGVPVMNRWYCNGLFARLEVVKDCFDQHLESKYAGNWHIQIPLWMDTENMGIKEMKSKQ